MTAEVRARVEELQGGLKRAKALLAEAPPRALEAASDDAELAETAAARIESEARAACGRVDALRERVEKEEQRLLAEEAALKVPAVAILLTLTTQLFAICVVFELYDQPRTTLLVLATQIVAIVAALPVAWVCKRRLF